MHTARWRRFEGLPAIALFCGLIVAYIAFRAWYAAAQEKLRCQVDDVGSTLQVQFRGEREPTLYVHPAGWVSVKPERDGDLWSWNVPLDEQSFRSPNRGTPTTTLEAGSYSVRTGEPGLDGPNCSFSVRRLPQGQFVSK